MLKTADDSIAAVQMQPGSSSGYAKGLMVSGTFVYYWSNSPTYGLEIFYTDGTAAPALLSDNGISPGSISSSYQPFPGAGLSNSLLFMGYSPSAGANVLFQHDLPSGPA